MKYSVKKSSASLISVVASIIFITSFSLSNAQDKSDVNKNEVEKHLKLGTDFLKEGHLELAEYEFKKLINFKPDDYILCKKIGNIYARQSKYEEAVVWYQKALDIKSDYSDAYNNLADCYKVEGEYGKAVELINKAIEINPEVGLYYITLAEICLKLGEQDKVIKFLKKAERYAQTQYERNTIDKIKSELLDSPSPISENIIN